MILTEKEAREKSCPLAGIANLITGNLADSKENHNCKSSSCMWWKVETEICDSNTDEVVETIGCCGIYRG